MKAVARRMVSAATLSFIASSVHAEPSPFEGIPSVRFEYYDVEGNTPREIYQSLMARGPRNGERWAQTTSQMRFNWREKMRGSSCRIVDAESRVAITVLLPRLVRSEAASPQALEFWRATRRRLELHEAGHARISWDRRDDFARAASRASCRSIQGIARDVQAKINALQQAYDKDTDYGREGVPPLML